MNRKEQAEKIAEMCARDFLTENFGRELFIGAHIERILERRATLIYQIVDDSKFFGATVRYENGDTFIALNTCHPLRIRYFTAAHELWHLVEMRGFQDEQFDHERAADRFAAAIMLPKDSVKEIWSHLKKQYTVEEAVVMLADLAAVPYLAVMRRLKELVVSVRDIPVRTEEEWVAWRKEMNLLESPLDVAQQFTRFSAYEEAVKTGVEQQVVDPSDAANKLARFGPLQAERWQQDVIKRVQNEASDE